jgi:hypothetical protein
VPNPKPKLKPKAVGKAIHRAPTPQTKTVLRAAAPKRLPESVTSTVGAPPLNPIKSKTSSASDAYQGFARMYSQLSPTPRAPRPSTTPEDDIRAALNSRKVRSLSPITRAARASSTPATKKSNTRSTIRSYKPSSK